MSEIGSRVVSAKEEWHVRTEERCWQGMTPTIGKRELHIFPDKCAAYDWLAEHGFEAHTFNGVTGVSYYRREEGMGYETMAWLRRHLVELVDRNDPR